MPRLFSSFNPQEADLFRERWFIVVLVAVLYTVMELPMDLAFNLPLLPWTVFDGFVVVVFSMDVYFNFFLPYRNSVDDWVYDRPKIREHYLKTWFMYDLISCLPVDFIVMAVTAQTSHPIQLLRLLKVFRLFRVMKLLQSIDVRGLPAWMQMWFLIYLFVLIAHWFACIFWKIAVIEGLSNSWVTLYPDLLNGAISQQYMQCLYWSVATVTTLGYGDIHPVTFPEYCFVTFAIMFGAACYAVIIAAIGGHFVSSRFAAKAEYNRFMEALESYEAYHNLPTNLREQIQDYCGHIWRRRKTFLNENVVRSLPLYLRTAIAEALYVKIIADSKLLSTCGSPGFLVQFARLFHPMGVCTPGQILFCTGQAITQLYFIRRGRVELRMPLENEGGDLVVGFRGDGQYCGDQGLFTSGADSFSEAEQGVHQVSASVMGFGDVYMVSASALLSLLESYPQEMRKFACIAIERKMACDEVLRLYETTPEISSNDRGGWFSRLLGRRPRMRRWRDIWLDVTSQRSDDELVSRVLASEMSNSIRSRPSIEFDTVPNEEFVVPREVGKLYRAFAGTEKPRPVRPQELPLWRRPPAVMSEIESEDLDVTERLERLEKMVCRVLESVQALQQQQQQQQVSPS